MNQPAEQPASYDRMLGDNRQSLHRALKYMACAVVLISITPFLLNAIGFDFGSHPEKFNLGTAGSATTPELVDHLHRTLSGGFTHTILEWSAFCTALFTVVLAFIVFRIKGDVTTPIIAVALFCAGCMDAFHTLAATRLIEATADNTDLIPFTWAICRAFNALIVMAGVTIILLRSRRPDASVSSGFWLVTVTSAAFGLVAYGVIHYCAVSQQLPRTMFPDAAVTRPWDAIALVLFICNAGLLWQLYRRIGGAFAAALWISVIADVATQLHMTFGSTALFDNHFNIAHALKIVTYLVPFAGISIDFVLTYRKEKVAVRRLSDEITERKKADQKLKEHSRNLERLTESLTRRNVELDEFTYVTSHDLQEPLRKLKSFSTLLRQDVGEDLNEQAETDLKYITEAADRMQNLVQDLLTLSRTGRTDMETTTVSMSQCAKRSIEALDQQVTESGARISFDELPDTEGDITLLTQLYQNLISNSLKYCQATPVIHLTVEMSEDGPVFGVRDNGIGMKEKYLDQIFAPFKRLHGRGEYEGTGIGLATCRKVVERHGGEIWVESQFGEGSHFKFTLGTKRKVAA